MQRSLLVLALMFTLASARLAAGAEQAVNLEPQPQSGSREAGMGVLAAATNVVYFPLRLALTTVTASVGGLVGWLNGGNPQSAQSVWDSTEGPAYVTARMLDGSEPWHLGAAGK